MVQWRIPKGNAMTTPYKYPVSNFFVDNNVITIKQALQHQQSDVVVYLVGGCVRDFFLTGRTPKDFDLTTNLTEEQIILQLRSNFAKSKGIHVKEKQSDTFGVVFVIINNTTYEVAPFRQDIGSDGRRPEKTIPSDIYTDAMRRDFTINNLYFCLDNNEILDFNADSQGYNDIQQKIIRPVGDPERRFDEDKLRVLRFARFYSRFNYEAMNISSNEYREVANLISEYYADLRSHRISNERIQDEFVKGVAQSLNTSNYLSTLFNLGLMKNIFKGIPVKSVNFPKIDNTKMLETVLYLSLDMQSSTSFHLLHMYKFSNDVLKCLDCINNVLYGERNHVNDSTFEALKYSFNVPRVKEVAADIACRLYYWDVDFKVKLFHFSRYTPIHVDAEKLMN